MRCLLALLGCGLAACSSGGGDAPRGIDAGRIRRVIEPPPGQVRPLPPHAIDPGGVGPYRLGVTPDELYAVLPSLPRIAILDVAGLLDAIVVRAEDDQLLVGGRAGERISFIAVLTPGIARTEGGLAVGVRRSALSALGPELSDPRTARDPRIFIPAQQPGARFLIEGERVIVILLQPVGEPAPVPAAPVPPAVPDAGVTDAGVVAPTCTGTLPGSEPELLAAASVAKGPSRIKAACLTPLGHEAIVIAGDTITVIDDEHDRAQRVTSIELRGLTWAAPLRQEPGRDDLIAIVEERRDDELTVSLVALRLEGGRLIKIAEDRAYHLTRTSTQVIGARSLEDVRLLITVEDRPDGYQVGGVLVATSRTPVAPLTPVTILRRRRVSTDPPSATMSVDAGAPAIDAGTPRDAGHDAGTDAR